MFNFNTEYRTTAGSVAIILGKHDEVYIGYIKRTDDSVSARSWDSEGMDRAGFNHLIMPIREFGIGKWLTKDPEYLGVVTTVSPHESSYFRLIGYVVDKNGRMFPESWSFSGSARTKIACSLDPNGDHDNLPF